MIDEPETAPKDHGETTEAEVDQNDSPTALSGIKVVCFGMGAAAPLATATLADFGAEVIKIEPPAGDWSRTTPGLGTREFNRNKKGVAIDLKADAGQALALRLIEKADVVMESFRPGVMDRLGLGYETVAKSNPRLIYCSVTAFGQTGPWKDMPGVDGIVQAASGIMSVLGRAHEDDLEPIKVPFPVADMAGGMLAAQGILLALLARERTGAGQHIDLSLLEAAMVLQKSSLTRFFHSGELPEKSGSRAPYATPNEAYRTADGYIMLAAYSPNRWHALCADILLRPELETDPRFETRQERLVHHAVLKPLIEEVLRTRETAHWMECCVAHDVMCAPINDYRQLMEMDQISCRGVVATMALQGGKSTHMLAPIPRLSGTPGCIRHPFPRRVGEHTEEVLRAAGLDEDEIRQLAREGAIGVPDAG